MTTFQANGPSFDPLICLHWQALFDVLSREHTFCAQAFAQPAEPAVPCAVSAPADQQEQSAFAEGLTLAPVSGDLKQEALPQTDSQRRNKCAKSSRIGLEVLSRALANAGN